MEPILVNPTNFNPEIVEELQRLLSKLRFTCVSADYQEGNYWRIYIHPWQSGKGDYFDAQISILPRTSKFDLDEEFQVAVSCARCTWFPSRRINRRGQLWFRDLPARGREGLSGEHSQSRDALEGDTGSFTVRSICPPDTAETAYEEPALAAASESSQDIPDPFIFYLSDHRVTVLLEQTSEGKAVLSANTEARELAGATVHFELRSERGEITLAPEDPPDGWSGYHVLNQSFKSAQESLPTFHLAHSQQE